MRASTVFILSLIAAICGYFLSMLLCTWEVMVCVTVITVGTCIVSTINKNFQQLRDDIASKVKDRSSDKENENA